MHSKGNHRQNKGQPPEWVKIFVNEATNKGLISKTHKQLMQLNIYIYKKPNQKMAKDLNRHFPKEDVQMAKSHMKRCLLSLVIREILLKTTMTYHFTLVRMALIKTSPNNKC